MYEIVTMTSDNTVGKRVFKTTSYAKALGFLEANIARRPNLDMIRDGRFVDWSFEPPLMGEAS